MDDLISRKVLIEAIRTPNGKYDTYVNVSADITLEEFIHEILSAYETQVVRCIEDQPPVEAKPVVHGSWETEFTALFAIYRCSECNCATALGQTNFCPNCGSRMKE